MAAARALKIASLALCVSTVAVQLPSVLNPSPSTVTTATSAEASPSPPRDGSVLLQILLPFIVMEALFVAVPFVYRQRQGHRRDAAVAAGAGNRRLPESSEVVACALCVVVGLLEYFLLAHQPAGGAPADGGAQARRALGLAALRVLPASAAATFFLGLALVYAHVGGGGDGPVPEHAVRILSEMTLEAGGALIGIMAVVICCSS